MVTVRRAQVQDVERARQLAVSTGMFSEGDSHDVAGQLSAAVGGTAPGTVLVAVAVDHEADVAHTAETDDEIDHTTGADAGADRDVVGAAYVAPEPYGDRVWNLYFLAVDPRHQGRGTGRRLVREVEQRLRALGPDQARVLLIETSSTAPYAGARAFYAALGYTHEATVREFYGPGDHKVVFWLRLSEQ